MMVVAVRKHHWPAVGALAEPGPDSAGVTEQELPATAGWLHPMSGSYALVHQSAAVWPESCPASPAAPDVARLPR